MSSVSFLLVVLCLGSWQYGTGVPIIIDSKDSLHITHNNGLDSVGKEVISDITGVHHEDNAHGILTASGIDHDQFVVQKRGHHADENNAVSLNNNTEEQILNITHDIHLNDKSRQHGNSEQIVNGNEQVFHISNDRDENLELDRHHLPPDGHKMAPGIDGQMVPNTGDSHVHHDSSDNVTEQGSDHGTESELKAPELDEHHFRYGSEITDMLYDPFVQDYTESVRDLPDMNGGEENWLSDGDQNGHGTDNNHLGESGHSIENGQHGENGHHVENGQSGENGYNRGKMSGIIQHGIDFPVTTEHESVRQLPESHDKEPVLKPDRKEHIEESHFEISTENLRHEGHVVVVTKHTDITEEGGLIILDEHEGEHSSHTTETSTHLPIVTEEEVLPHQHGHDMLKTTTRKIGPEITEGGQGMFRTTTRKIEPELTEGEHLLPHDGEGMYRTTTRKMEPEITEGEHLLPHDGEGMFRTTTRKMEPEITEGEHLLPHDGEGMFQTTTRNSVSKLTEGPQQRQIISRTTARRNEITETEHLFPHNESEIFKTTQKQEPEVSERELVTTEIPEINKGQHGDSLHTSSSYSTPLENTGTNVRVSTGSTKIIPNHEEPVIMKTTKKMTPKVTVKKNQFPDEFTTPSNETTTRKIEPEITEGEHLLPHDGGGMIHTTTRKPIHSQTESDNIPIHSGVSTHSQTEPDNIPTYGTTESSFNETLVSPSITPTGTIRVSKLPQGISSESSYIIAPSSTEKSSTSSEISVPEVKLQSNFIVSSEMSTPSISQQQTGSYASQSVSIDCFDCNSISPHLVSSMNVLPVLSTTKNIIQESTGTVSTSLPSSYTDFFSSGLNTLQGIEMVSSILFSTETPLPDMITTSIPGAIEDSSKSNHKKSIDSESTNVLTSSIDSESTNVLTSSQYRPTTSYISSARISIVPTEVHLPESVSPTVITNLHTASVTPSTTQLSSPESVTPTVITNLHTASVTPSTTQLSKNKDRPTSSIYINIDMKMTLYEFCELQQNFVSQLADIMYNTQKSKISQEQIKLQYPIADDCDQPWDNPKEEVEIQIYVLDITGKLDRSLTIDMAKNIKPGLKTSELYGKKLESVKIVNEPNIDEIHPTNGQSASKIDEEIETGITIAISIAAIGGFCCVALLILQLIIHKRTGKRMHPYFPGSGSCSSRLSTRSLNSIALGVVSKSRPNSGLWNPGLDISDENCNDPSHPLVYSTLTDFSLEADAIYQEFQLIPNETPRLSCVPVGAEDKNRFANVLPFPHSRVKLQKIPGEDFSDYINANYITGYKEDLRAYIATQAPLSSTAGDFWRMVWEQQSRVILMLTDMDERGQPRCIPYWPEKTGMENRLTYGDFIITLKKKEVHQEYIVSVLEIKDIEKNLVREVRHFWYTCWPSDSTPEPISLVKFVLDTRPYYEDSGAPVVVHCSPGTGRTGTLIAIDICMRSFEDKRSVNVLNTVYKMRKERAGVVHTKDQYNLIYKAVGEYAIVMNTPTSISTSSSVATLQNML
ncbi:Receptor-type tyrosine-protein phosphatase F,Receptor-type tyrosine-protein phosphatase S,Tyrosine-protein phosphatase 10D,Receptor-type tyrosine-protein phosphatase gamma,Receptor-type tyrosine-protein phosphatase delta [Mytilus coruscus]|uniref:Uncharacterized protein n=1 Tax=Mytilus coruscus TaxID=42192 RepID=A0A6J8BIA8_MYTCO|nr:Receptor-type tyrosine-protein phosphatase F,Receptor-type tyrosine-protein phosphatase S,Tyrosine-protein phosphatase 10D,Receptor-type tyrosine-protein phosphatase gamma,Receptor-type tyrosine-protein phosphatase delta [Mytilus coruscus]